MTPLTQKRMERVVIFNTHEKDFELFTLAAAHKGISRSELIRQAAREKSGKILAGIDAATAEST
jgi:hypothetical protein